MTYSKKRPKSTQEVDDVAEKATVEADGQGVKKT